MKNSEKKIIQSTSLLGVKINILTKDEVLAEIESILSSNEIGKYIVTPYSEYFLAAQKDSEFKQVLNQAHLSLADGVFVQWATSLLAQPINHKGLLRFFVVLFYYIYFGLAIIFARKRISQIVPERIQGSIITYDIAKLAAKKAYKVAILGGYNFGKGNTGIIAAEKLKQQFPTLNFVEIYPGNREKEEEGEKVVQIIKNAKADILLCAYTPVREEKWLAKHLSEIGIKLGIGIGGTLDYISGEKKHAPNWIRKIGLEWFVRPIISEGASPIRILKRIKRSWFDGFIRGSILVVKEKSKSAN